MSLDASGGTGVEEVDIYFMGQTVMGYLHNRLSDAVRYTNPSAGGGGEAMLSNFTIHGRPAVLAKKCPAGRIYGLSKDTWIVAVHRDANYTPQGFRRPTNQDARTNMTLLQTNIKNTNPRRNFVYSGIVA